MKKIMFYCLFTSVFLFLLSLLLSADQNRPGMDFIAEAEWIYNVFACGEDTTPQGLPGAQDPDYCKKFRTGAAGYRENYIKKVRPFLARLRPKDLPRRVVYPFGGNDLASAMATWPDMREVTTISLENAGDPLRIITASPAEKMKALKNFKKFIRHILSFHDHSNADVRLFEEGLVPGQVTLSLVAASLYGYAPVSLRFFRLEKNGRIHYLTRNEISRLETKKAQRLHHRWKRPPFSEAFCNMELVLKKISNVTGSRRIIHRHIAWNLDNRHFAGSALEKHLRAKGRVSAMVKGGSYLLWFNSFSALRRYLLENMAFMYSDATGILPRHARAAGFEQITFGRFYGAFLKNNGGKNAEEMKRLFDREPRRTLPFRYGHADIRGARHLIVTRPRKRERAKSP